MVVIEEKIFCLGRPVLDINVNIREDEWWSLSKSSLILLDNLSDYLEILELKADYYSISAGGVESNLAINCALLGLSSIFVGAVGNDILPLILQDRSRDAHGRLTLELRKIGQSSAMIAIVRFIEQGETRIKLINYGASEGLEWPGLEDKLKSCTTFFSSLFAANSPHMEAVWKEGLYGAVNLRKKIIINLGGINTIPPYKRSVILEIIGENADLVSMNGNEYMSCVENETQLRKLFSHAEVIIVTEGEEGAIIYTKDNRIRVAAIGIEDGFPKFRVGCGDAFLAGFLSATHLGVDIEEAGIFASRVASLKLQHPESHLAANMGDQLLEMGGKNHAFYRRSV